MRYSGNNIKLMVDNMMVNYTDAGPDDAPVIICIHGFPLNMFMWDKQVGVLIDHFRVITYDIRGHGESDAGNEAFSIDLFVSDLISFMNALNLDKVSLCGLSMGGYIALKAIEGFPARFEALVLCDTTCMADSPEAKEKRMKAVESIIQHGVAQYADASIKNFFPQDSFTTSPEIITSVREMIMKTSELSLCSTLLALSSRRETGTKIADIQVPVLILVGSNDVITPLSAATFMHDNITKSTLQVIDHAGHLSNMENPEEFNRHLKLFFNSVYADHLKISQGGDSSILRELRYKLNMLLSFRSI